MEFIQTPYIPLETIAVIATPPGEGGIAIVRITGENALSIGDRLFSGRVSTYLSHTAHFGYIRDEAGKKIDEALLLVMKGKKSFTGEDTVEIQCHGGRLASMQILNLALKQGARLARPGEFTLKAFMNGKIDLSQAEAIQRLIHAKNETAFFHANSHLEGLLSKKIKEYQAELTEITAVLEAWVDFPEEGLEFLTMDEVISKLSTIVHSMKALENSFEEGRKIHEGISLCIVGCPNVGKSSLMNALLKKERAIVTPIAGTTRDVLEEDLLLNGLHFRLIDTAGIRESDEIVEQEGIKRTRLMLQQADLILMVIDASLGIREEEKEILQTLPKEKTLIVWNKIDLIPSLLQDLDFPYITTISAKHFLNLENLKQMIDQIIWDKGAPEKEEVLITSQRHKEALSLACSCCEKVITGLQNAVSCEFLLFDLRHALNALGLIIGTNVTEDVLSSIFSQFCIGK